MGDTARGITLGELGGGVAQALKYETFAFLEGKNRNCKIGLVLATKWVTFIVLKCKE